MRRTHARPGPSEAPPSATRPVAPGLPPAGAVPVLASLRERKVVQWTLAYAAAAAALLQLVALVAAQFAWPEAIARSAIVLLACGLPVAAVIAWYHGDKGAQRVGGTELSILALLFAVGAALLWRVNTQAVATPTRAAVPAVASGPATPRIAVLPLDNLSPDPANAFFADGLHDELLTALARLRSLEVISRTTMLSYRDARPSMQALADELGASHLLEGTVRREGDTVRMNLQLIEIPADRHVWAQAYTRRIDDSLALQGEVALAVADELNTRIASERRTDLAPSGSVDPRALDALLKARQVTELVDPDGFGRRRQLLDAAVAAAPDYGPARAERATHYANRAWFAVDEAGTAAQVARADLALAERLAPEDVATVLARIYVKYYVDRDFRGALVDADRATAKWPRIPELMAVRMRLLRRLGRFEEAEAIGEQVMALDPRNPDAYETPIETRFQVRRDYAGARELTQRLLALRPDSPLARQDDLLAFLATGDLERWVDACARHAANQANDLLRWSRELFCAVDARDWAAANRLASETSHTYVPLAGDRRMPLPWLRHQIAVLLGDRDLAARWYPRALASLEAEQARQPDSAFPWLWMAHSQAIEGHRAEARKSLAEGLARVESEQDALLEGLARNEAVHVEAALGDRDAALARLRTQLHAPWGWHAANVVHDGRLAAAMGDHAGFRALLEELRADFARRNGTIPTGNAGPPGRSR
jgi:TolB-like protein